MATTAVVSKTLECTCEQNSSGTCDCVCEVPCVFNAENKVVEYTCICQGPGNQRVCCCKFQVRCNRQGGCPEGPSEAFKSACQCGKQECKITIRKCRGCEILSIDCQCPDQDSCCGKSCKK